MKLVPWICKPGRKKNSTFAPLGVHTASAGHQVQLAVLLMEGDLHKPQHPMWRWSLPQLFTLSILATTYLSLQKSTTREKETSVILAVQRPEGGKLHGKYKWQLPEGEISLLLDLISDFLQKLFWACDVLHLCMGTVRSPISLEFSWQFQTWVFPTNVS